MTKNQFYTQRKKTSQFRKLYVFLPVLLAVLMFAAIWGTTAVYAAPPVITPGQTFTVNENSANGWPVGTVATTGDLATSFSIVAGNTGNAFAIDNSGDIVVQTGTAIDYESTSVFTLTIEAANLDGSVQEDVIINVNDVNDAPVVPSSHAFSIVENNNIGDLVGTISATDPDFNVLSYSIIQWLTAPGPFLLNEGNGTITATAQLDYETDQHEYRFIVQVSDGGASNNTIVTINLTDGNDAPVAVDDVDAAYTVAENNTLNITTPTVLDNDVDSDGDGLTAVNASTPANGVVTLNTDGTFSYTPNPGFDGVDTFTYQAQDDGVGNLLSNVATVYITVTGNNDAPTALDNSYSTPEETPLTVAAPGILDNDTDPENDSLTAVLVTDVQNGTLVLNIDGSFVYTPNVNFVGDDTFTYQANDGSLLSNTAVVTITVTNENDPPTAVPDEYATNEDTTLIVTAPGVLANDTDPENDPLTAYLDTNVSNGTLAFLADGSFIYTPTLNFNGIDIFTYYAEDDSNAASASTTVTITVIPQNDPPVAVDDAGGSYQTNEDTPLTISAPGVLSNDSDIDGDNLTAVNASTPANGTVNLNSDGSFVYTPNAQFNGTDTFTYQAQDDGDGFLLSNTATVTITVIPANDAPDIQDQSFTIDENSPVTTTVGTVTVTDIDNVVPDDISFGKLPGGLGFSSFDIDANGEITVIDNSALDMEARQSLTLTVIVSDTGPLTDTAVITINLNNVNEFNPEITAGQSFTIPESSPINTPVGTVAATDDDYGESPAAFNITGGNTDNIFAIDNNGNLRVSDPTNLDFETTDTYTLTIEVTDDGTNPGANTGSGQVVVHITDANDAPVIDSVSASPTTINETEMVTVTVNFSDSDLDDAHEVTIEWGDGSPASVISVEPGAGEAEAAHTYQDDDPSGTSSDSYTINVTVTDDGTPNLSDTDSSVQITVNNVAPVLSNVAISPIDINEGEFATLTGDIADVSPDDTFTINVDWGDGSGVNAYSYAAGTTMFTETHTFIDDGQPLNIQVTLTDDDTGSDTGSTTINVTNVAPTVDAGPSQIVNVNTPVTFAGSFDDPGSGDTHTIEWDFGDAGTATGSLTPQHTYAAIGVYTATLTVTDDDGGTHSDTVVITVVSPSDVVATKTVSGDFAEEGTIFYTIIVTNTGASAQQDNDGDELVDVLPAELTLVSAQVVNGGGTAVATLATNTVTWNGSIESGSSVEISIEATILTGTKGVTVSNQATLSYDADGDGSNEATTYSDDPAVSGDYDPTVFEVRNEYFVFLPVILNNFISAPDLVVTHMSASSDLIEVVIENQGNATVFNSFWVDFYINPNPIPTVANELWPELASEGLAWGVTETIAAGSSITLTYSTAPGAPNLYFVATESLYNGVLPAGTPVYVQADSARAGIGNGAVAELDELSGSPYNNILGGTAVASSSTSP